MQYTAGYYRFVHIIPDLDNWSDKVGQLFYAHGFTESEVKLIQGDDYWAISLDEFEQAFIPAPEGVHERQLEMVELMGNLHAIGTRQEQLAIKAKEIPALPAPGDINEPVNVSKALATIGDQCPELVAKNLKTVKTHFAATQRQIKKRQDALARILKEQQLILAAKAAVLNDQIKIATEAIYMINAYLGQDEELVRIRSGKPAPIETPITVRQLVLFMDEESAAANNWAERGGMDFENVTDFDKWILTGDHLQQVLPESKGIVAIKPRRSNKYYDENPFVNGVINRNNKCLYLLVRNGDILYRIYTTLWLDDVLFPRKDEFDQFFFSNDYDWEENKSVRNPLKPGSDQYLEEMKKAQASQRRYYTVLLLIQGILDRTKVMHPLPIERMNICDLSESRDYIVFLKDAENTLGMGRLPFKQWLSELNSKICNGSRIVGRFNPTFSHSEFGVYSGEDRKRPKGAVTPLSDKIHVVEEKNEEFFFRYSRNGDTVYSNWGRNYGEAKRRASYLIYPKRDKFFINYDDIDVNDIQYYLNSRIERHEYQTMLPLLKIVLKMKAKEAAEEEPFRKLLIGEIMKKHEASYTIANEKIDELIAWWKFKTRTHRALNSDDKKALRMIVTEFNKRILVEKSANEDTHSNKMLLDSVMKNDNLLAVFKRPDGDYTVYYFYNDENVFVKEERWSKKAAIIEIKPWQTVDKRHETWHMIWAHERWASWKIGARIADHVTDLEGKEALEMVLASLRNCDEKLVDEEAGRLWMSPISAEINKDGNAITVFFVGRHAIIPKKNILTNSVRKPTLRSVEVKIAKKSTGVQYKLGSVRHLEICKSMFKKKAKDILEVIRKDNQWMTGGGRIIKTFEDNIKLFYNECEAAATAEAIAEKMREPTYLICDQAHEAIIDNWYVEQKKKFDEEYIDDDEGTMWMDYKDDLTVPSATWPSWVYRAAEYVVERGFNVNGMTIEKMVDRAKKFGYKEKENSEYSQVKDLVIDLSYKRRYRN